MKKPAAVVLASAVASGACLVVVAQPARAATARCDTSRSVYYQNDRYRRVRYPVHANPAGPSTWACLMSSGMLDSAAVTVMQRGLNECYGADLALDGDFGSLTRQALQRAQRAMGVDDDGVYGPRTAAAMKYAVRTTAGSFVTCSTYKL